MLAVLGIALAVLVNLAAVEYYVPIDFENADMAALSGRTIVIDPGHGGIDGGAKYHGLSEKKVTLEMALQLGQVLQAGGASVVYTRESDIDYYTRGKGGKRSDLLKRVDIINTSEATIFISIHTNAIRGGQWFGAEVYYHPKWPENKQLAEVMQQALRGFPPGNRRQAKQDSDILVLKDTNIPGILIETGFLSNPREAVMLADPAYQRKMAEQIAKALAYHFSHNVAR
jgi:N-acetylmuramoyl-L-alanine amidase